MNNRYPSPARKIPLGPAIDWTDEEIERLAEVTAADIQAAQIRWRDTSGPLWKNLLDAEDITPDAV